MGWFRGWRGLWHSSISNDTVWVGCFRGWRGLWHSSISTDTVWVGCFRGLRGLWHSSISNDTVWVGCFRVWRGLWHSSISNDTVWVGCFRGWRGLWHSSISIGICGSTSYTSSVFLLPFLFLSSFFFFLFSGVLLLSVLSSFKSLFVISFLSDSTLCRSSPFL